MTLREIAEMAGVSPSTVSRVINKNDEKCASKPVRERIWEIVQKTGYVPNKYAQGLKLASEEKTMGEARGSLACVFGRVKDFCTDQFFSSVYHGAEQAAFKRGYSIRYTVSFTQLKDSSSNIEIGENGSVQGVLVLGRCSGTLMQYIARRYKNIVYAGLNSVSVQIDQITCNGYGAACEAVSYLNLLGHTELGYIGEIDNEVRYRGYFDTMKKLGLVINREHIVDVPLTMDGGYNGAKLLMSRGKHPTGAFCCNDVTAVGVIRAIKEIGCKIPEDISIISIDDIDMAQYVTPTLTTVSIPTDEMGKVAAEILINRIEGGHRLPLKVELPFSIVKRASCSKKQDGCGKKSLIET